MDESWGNLCSRRSDCVPFPTPGAPTKMTRAAFLSRIAKYPYYSRENKPLLNTRVSGSKVRRYGRQNRESEWRPFRGMRPQQGRRCVGKLGVKSTRMRAGGLRGTFEDKPRTEFSRWVREGDATLTHASREVHGC